MSEMATKELKIRMPERLHRRIDDAAHKARRTMTQEVVMRLEESFRSKPTWDQQAVSTIATTTANEILQAFMKSLQHEGFPSPDKASKSVE
jgi:hypothetical protein